MSDAPPIPSLASCPVLGDSDGLAIQSGHCVHGSQVPAAQGVHTSGTAAALAGSWHGEAAGTYQSFSGRVATAFLDAATTLEGVGNRLARYASELAGLQS